METTFLKVAKFLVKTQNSDGTWRKPIKNEPRALFTKIATAAEGAKTLIYTGVGNTSKAIKKAFAYVMNYPLEEADPIDLFAIKLKILKIAGREDKKLEEWLKEKNPLKYGKVPFLSLQIFSETLGYLDEKVRDEVKKGKAAGKYGWGTFPKDKKTYPTSTSNVLLSLLLAGEDPHQKWIQKARVFLERSQNKNGSWNSSRLTVEKPTVYATAIATTVLMLLSRNPFNKRVEAGIRYVLDAQNEDGGWPFRKGENSGLYPTMYATKLLRFYLYLKENLKNKEYLTKFFTPQRVTCYLYRKFEFELPKLLLKEVCIKDLLNSKAIAATKEAIRRRRDIIKILLKGKKDVAGIIDELNKIGYNLNKKSHITQIKFDVEHLREMNLIEKVGNEYFVVVDLGF